MLLFAATVLDAIHALTCDNAAAKGELVVDLHELQVGEAKQVVGSIIARQRALVSLQFYLFSYVCIQ